MRLLRAAAPLIRMQQPRGDTEAEPTAGELQRCAADLEGEAGRRLLRALPSPGDGRKIY